MSDRTLSSCSHKVVNTNCKKCGVYFHSTDPSIKTKYYESYLNCSSTKYLKHMRKRQCKIVEGKDIQQSTYTLLQSICDKFQYTIETLALGIYIYAKTCKHQDKDQKFWASAALIVASKGIQLDKRVPYLNRYQRYADKSFTQQDYQLAEKDIFQQLDFDLQYTTFVSFLNFYLTSGVVFKSDTLNSAILKYVEDDMIEKAKDYIRNGEFLNHPPQKLALSIVKQIRLKFRLEPWKKQLQIVSGFGEDQIRIIEKAGSNILKPLAAKNTILQKTREKQLSNVSLSSMPINTLQMSLNLTEQKFKSGKKKFEGTIKFQSTIKMQNIKENSNKMSQQFPLSTLRNQTLSTSKYGNNFMLASTEKIIPLNSFVRM